MGKVWGLILALQLAACASVGEPGWRNEGRSPFENAKARCQIETQAVDGPDWERCMNALGWHREAAYSIWRRIA